MANKEVINATDLISILLTSTCFAELASSTQFAGYLEHLAEQQAFLELTARPFGMQKARQPLRVRKTRENLKQQSVYADIPPPCLHSPHSFPANDSYSVTTIESSDTLVSSFTGANQGENKSYRRHDRSHNEQPQPDPPQPTPLGPKVQRQLSASRRMLTRVKHGIAKRSKEFQSSRGTDVESGLARRFSGRRKQSYEVEQRAHSFELSRDSIIGTEDGYLDGNGSNVTEERSFTESTVSTADVFEEGSNDTGPQFHNADSDKAACTQAERSSSQDESPSSLYLSSTQKTPRPPGPLKHEAAPDAARIDGIVVPHVALDVRVDCNTLDVNAKHDVWIAIKATVRVNPIGSRAARGASSARSHQAQGSALIDDTRLLGSQLSGEVTILRLCFKPIGDCRIRDAIGRRTLRNPSVGADCQMFLRLHVPRHRAKSGKNNLDQDCLLAQLESMIGMLETEILQVEARYRHSLLPSDHVVSVRHVCRINRPEIESRWSMITFGESLRCPSEAEERLAWYLASEFSGGRALELMHEYLCLDVRQNPDIRRLEESLQAQLETQSRSNVDDPRPSVVITDVDWKLGTPAVEHFSTAPSTPVESQASNELDSSLSAAEYDRHSSNTSLLTPTRVAPPLISPPKTTIALTRPSGNPLDSVPSAPLQADGGPDTARQLWRHLRRTSLSAKQLDDMSAERVEHLEATNDGLRDLRKKAIANKRSIGAETLKDWKWETDFRKDQRSLEAPWM